MHDVYVYYIYFIYIYKTSVLPKHGAQIIIVKQPPPPSSSSFFCVPPSIGLFKCRNGELKMVHLNGVEMVPSSNPWALSSKTQSDNILFILGCFNYQNACVSSSGFSSS